MKIEILSEIDLQILEKEIETNEIEEIEKILNKDEFRQYVYSKGYWDIEFFSDYFLPHRKQKFLHDTKEFIQIDTPEFHKEIRRALDNGEDINIIIARGHGKTTAILIRIMHALLYKKLDSIIYIASAGLGEEGIGKIRYELETNEAILKIFGNMVPNLAVNKIDKSSRKWRQKLLQLANGTSVETITQKGSIRGKRPKKIIVDDPQENKDVKNKKIVEEFNVWIFSALYNTLLPGGSMCVLGTVIGNLCLVKHLKDVRKWNTIQYEGCDENMENILWPDMWSKEDLIKRKQKIGTAQFNQEFRNIPLNTVERVIKEHWIRYYVPPLNFDYTVLAVDPATKTKEKNDFTGLCLAGVIEHRKYIIYCKGVKLPPRELEQFIYNINHKFEPDVIIKEDNIEVKLTDDLKARGLPVESVWTHKDKYTRLLGIAGMFEVGDVYFLKVGQDGLIEQLTSYPDIANDDEMDACIMALTKLQRWIEKGGSGGGAEIIEI